MRSLAETSLTADERALLDRYVAKLRSELAHELRGVWLFGSRARGEAVAADSDVDVLVLVEDASWDGRMSVRRLLDEAARELAMDGLAWSFSVHVHDEEWLRQRRQIRSFFVAEVDRDKIVIFAPERADPLTPEQRPRLATFRADASIAKRAGDDRPEARTFRVTS
jgi:predicted nucleotidyltransferase